MRFHYQRDALLASIRRGFLDDTPDRKQFDSDDAVVRIVIFEKSMTRPTTQIPIDKTRPTEVAKDVARLARFIIDRNIEVIRYGSWPKKYRYATFRY